MCDTEVVVECFNHRDPFRKWPNQNADKLLQSFPTLRKHGIYIATTTYSCSHVHINVWHSKDDEIKIGVKVGVTGIGGLWPSGKWMRGYVYSQLDFIRSGSLPISLQMSMLICLGKREKSYFLRRDQDQVLELAFARKSEYCPFLLVYGSESLQTRTTEVPQSEWRGDGDKFSVKDPSPGGEIYEAELEMIGENPDVLAEEAREKQEIWDLNEDE